MKHLLTTTALGLLLAVSPAAAQDEKPAGQPAQQSQEQQPGSPAAPNAQPDAAQQQEMQEPGSQAEQTGKTDIDKTAEASSGETKFVNEQQEGDRLASNLIGATVTDANDENIGEISDLLLDENGSITAAVLGVGGFLGIGEKSVAVNMDSLEISEGENGGMKVTLDTTRESLESAPDFVSLEDKQAEQDRAARQSSSPSGNNPMGGGGAPSGQ